MSSSQMISSNFGIWYREGPQKQKILSFLYVGTKNFWIEFQFCRQKLYQIEGLFFQIGVSSSKKWPYKKLKTLKSESTQISIWRPNSTHFSDGKTTLSLIFWFKLTELSVLSFLSFWGPSLYQIMNHEDFIWLELISTLRRT